MYKLGRKEPKQAPSLWLGNFLTGVIPEHPLSEDYLSAINNWQMLGNDQYGDCVAVAWANERNFVTTLLTDNPYYPNQQEVYDVYKTQNPHFPNQDDGMDIQTLLEYLHKNGDPTGAKPVAFAAVDYTNLEEVKAALAIFGSLWLGFYVQQANMGQFDSGLPWDYVRSSPVIGGHCVLAGGYYGTPSNDVRFITWAEETGFTDNFWNREMEEAWVVIYPENLGTKQFQEGVDLEQLKQDYFDLTGDDLPIPEPPVPPTPPDNGGITDQNLDHDNRTGDPRRD